MANLIALEWDTHEARVAVASPRGNDLVVEQAFAIPLSGAADEGVPTISEVGQQLAVALSAKGLTGGDGLVALPRSSIELRTLMLPMAPPEEIPDMVRFQAMQAFTSIGEDWPLDYVELDRHDESINVLAAVVSPKEIKQVQEVCAASELKTRCLVLRPFAAVALLHRFESIDVFRGGLIVDVLPDGADLTVISSGQVVFMRSVRLPIRDDVKAQVAALVGELRRTIGAAQNQMGGSRIEQIILCGDESQHAVLRQRVAEALSLDVVTFDPFEAVRPTRQLKQNLPENSGRYAPLLGMLACKATGTGHTLDFLNPRKRPKPPSNKRRNVVIAASVAVVLALGTLVVMIQKQKLDDQIAQLNQESTELDVAVDKARNLVARVDRIKVFTDGDITWLDEIREVATHLPDADHVILHEISMGADRGSGGRLVLKGNVCSSEVIAQLEQSLRYGGNTVHGKMGVIDRSNREYPYQLNTTILVPPDVQKNGHSLGRPELDAAPESSPKGQAKETPLADVTKHGATADEQSNAETTVDAQTPDVDAAAKEPGDAEPAREEPVKPEPVDIEPVDKEPAKTEPAKTEPAKTEPAKTEPGKTEPAKTESVESEPDSAETARRSAELKSAGASDAQPRARVTGRQAS